MIPRRIKLRNFLSYRECELDLTGLHIAVLTGKNGEGKSALLDAMTGAVWGAARGSIEDDRIRLHADEMLVDFEFEAHGDRFEVIRKRTRGKRSGEVHFFQLDGEGGRTALTGGTVSETQAEIIRRVRMDYDTFASSAFVAQGHADEFTRKKPAERKEIFRKVLGLQLYEELSASAGDRKKDATRELKAIADLVHEAQAQVAQLPAVEEELACIAREGTALGPRAVCLETEAAELRRFQDDFQRLRAEADAASGRVRRADLGLATDRDRRAKAEAGLAAIHAVLSRAGEVHTRHESFLALRARERELAKLQEQAHAIAARIQQAGQAIASEEMRLRTLAGEAERDVQRLEDAATALATLRETGAGFERETAALQAARAAVEDDRVRLTALQHERALADAERDRCRTEGNELVERRKQLAVAEGGAACPVCRQPLNPAELKHVLDEYRGQIRDLRERMERAKAKAQDTADAIGTMQAAITDALAGCERREAELQRRKRDHHARAERAEEAAAALPPRKAELAAALTVLEQGTFAHEARKSHCDAREELCALDYDEDAHRRMRSEREALEGVEEELRRLVAAEERAAALGAQLGQLAGDVDESERELGEAREAAARAEAALALGVDVGPKLAASEAELAALRAEAKELALRQGRKEQERAQLRALVAKTETASEQLASHREAEATYGDLAKAFGRDGVQAMLIEQSLPRVEQVANEMLDRMTGGRINVALATQKQTASGTTRETLDIRISDELGTRDYEMYSGGEAFRVDFALRIALARLLAERAGAELPTLIIDEGFGSQDQEGIDRLVEALQAIRDDFKLILVVTHVEELRERFERRIEVTKDAERGSLARVV